METYLSKVLVTKSIPIFCMLKIMVQLNLKTSADNEKKWKQFCWSYLKVSFYEYFLVLLFLALF